MYFKLLGFSYFTEISTLQNTTLYGEEQCKFTHLNKKV